MSLGSEYGDLYEDYLWQLEEFNKTAKDEDKEIPMAFSEWVQEESQRQRYKYEDSAEDVGTERE